MTTGHEVKFEKSTHAGARLPPRWVVSPWVTFFQDGGFERAKACGYVSERILDQIGGFQPGFS